MPVEGQKRKKSEKRGFTLIEVMVFLSIFVLATVTFFQAFAVGINYIIETKKKLQAVELASEQIEKMRNLGYSNLAAGTTEDVVTGRNGIPYRVTTRITDFDDAADGDAPADLISWDYYKVGVEVEWDTQGGSKNIVLSAVIVPPVREEDADKGYMRLHVIDQNGDGLPSADVEIRNLGNNQLAYAGPVSFSGNLFLTGLNAGNYQIKVKDEDGIYPVETKAAAANFTPYDPHASIAVKTLTEKYIQTDKKATLNLDLVDTFGTSPSGLDFDITGGRIIGWDGNTVPVYDFSQSVTDSDGSETFTSQSFGPYFVNFTDLNDGTRDYSFLWMTPISDRENEVLLNADTTLEAEALLAPNDVPSLLIAVLDNADSSPVYGATVHVVRTDAPAYDATLTTNEFGKAYFPEIAGDMENQGYDVTITAEGYAEENKAIEVDNFTAETILIQASL